MATVELRYSPKDTAWFIANATMVLKAGEPAYHATTGLFKLGDGTTQLSALPFLPATGGGGGGGNFVPYTGATGDVDLGEYELKAGQIELDQTPTGTASVAVTRWNDTNGLTETTLKGGSVIIKNGIDLVARVVNKVTPNATLTKAQYQVVKISGAQGQRLAVGLAQANNDNNSADTLGVAIETITTNQEGFIMCVGVIENINTTGSLQGETWADGDVLYLSPTTAGAITKVKPTGLTGHIVVIGYVEYAHANNGKIYVKVMNGWELDELHNVYINNPANNEVLTYESATSLWKNKAISTGLTTGITTIASGTNTNILYNNSGVLGEYSTTGTGTTAVLSTSPTFVTDIKTPNITGINGNLTLTNNVQSIGAITQFTFTNVANTNQTASTNIPNFILNGSTKTWAAGAITNQYWSYFTANIAAFASASTITNSYGLYVEAATAGTNATITNNYAAGFGGNILINTGSTKIITGEVSAGNTGVWMNVVPSSTNYFIQHTGSIGIFNAPSQLQFRVNNTITFSCTNTQVNFVANIAPAENVHFILGTSTGTKIGTATSQKIGFWNATPIVQPTTAVTAATLVSNAGTALTSTDTFDGYTLQQVVKALRNTGLLA